jgi:8-hydroxy-5-deazaflavin:NADPH oxidoreductase
MQIGIIGFGNVGSTLARLAVVAGFDVVIANRRGPASLGEIVGGLGPRARAVPVEGVGRGSAFVLEAIPFGRLRELPVEAIDGLVLVTAANYFPGRDGPLDLPGTQSEHVARLFQRARVVKAFNTIRAPHLRDQGEPDRPVEERRAIPLAGDDGAAKELVATFVRAIGFGPLDLGTLASGRLMEPGGPLFDADLTVAAARGRLDALAGTGPRPA